MATRPATKSEKHHKIDIGLTDEQRQGSAALLNTVLADLHIIYIKSRNYHWNVIGPQFYGIHSLLEEQYTELADAIDVVAERVRMVGGRALGTMAEFISTSRLEEKPEYVPNARDMLHDLLHDHETTIRNLREDIKKAEEEYDDATTADILTAQAQIHEKAAWMLGSLVADDHSLNEQEGKASKR
jgi:starvation-inducible DNA-binding protein